MPTNWMCTVLLRKQNMSKKDRHVNQEGGAKGYPSLPGLDHVLQTGSAIEQEELA